MQSSNPIFRRSEGFNGRGNSTMSSPATWSTGAAAGAGHAPGGYDQGGYGGGYKSEYKSLDVYSTAGKGRRKK